MKKTYILTSLFTFTLLLFSSLPSFAQHGCSRSAVYLNNVVDLGNNQYQIDMTFCVGAGETDGVAGACRETGAFGFQINGGATLTNYPDSLVSPNTGAVHYPNTYGANNLIAYESNLFWWACINGGYWGYNCGPIQTVCEDVTLITIGLPSSIDFLGAEGGGLAANGCPGLQVDPSSFNGNSQNPCTVNDLALNTSADLTSVVTGYGNDDCATLTGTVSGGSGSYSYEWNNGATTASITVCPTVTTTYTLTVTDLICGFQTSSIITIDAIDVRCGRSNNKVRLCYRGRTRCVSTDRAAQLLNKGATLGSCSNNNYTRSDYSSTANVMEANEEAFEVFPNPIKTTATIAFQIEESGVTTIQLFDLNGKKVQEIFNGEVEAGSYNEVEFNRSSFAAGLYIARLKSSTGIQKIQKVIIR